METTQSTTLKSELSPQSVRLLSIAQDFRSEIIAQQVEVSQRLDSDRAPIARSLDILLTKADELLALIKYYEIDPGLHSGIQKEEH